MSEAEAPGGLALLSCTHVGAFPTSPDALGPGSRGVAYRLRWVKALSEPPFINFS